MAEKSEKHKEDEKKRKKKIGHGYNVEPAEKPVEGPTGKKGFKV